MGAIPITELAKEKDVKIMVGCMSESAFGIAAAVHFSLGLSVDHMDLDSHLNYTKAIGVGLSTREGINYVSGKPGLGVEVNGFGDECQTILCRMG